MKTLGKTATSMCLALLIGATASAQSGNQGAQSNGQKGDGKQQKDSGQSQGHPATIRGELAGVSVVGETMVDYSSGRGVVAQFTYLTVLGSPSDSSKPHGDRSGKSGAKPDDKDDKKSGSDKKDQGSKPGQAKENHGDKDGSGQMSAGRRRNVYQIAVGPDTHVRVQGSQGGQGSGDQKGGQGGSARERSKAALEHLQLGDRIEVKYTRMTAQDNSGSGGEGQGGSADQTRHGRNRLVRGVAQEITILPSSDEHGDHKGSEGQKGGDSSDGKGQSSSESSSKEKKSDQ